MGHLSRNRNYDLILKHFATMWLLTILGVLVSFILPFWLVMTLSMLCIGMLAAVYMTALSNPFFYYSIPFFMGVLQFLVMTVLIDWLGKALVISVFIGTVIIFLLLAFLCLKLITEIADSAVYLFAVIIVFVVFFFIYIFVPIHSTIMLILAGIFVLLFSIYTMYDLNNIRNHFVKDSEVVAMSLGLYLNFIHVFFNLVEVTRKNR